MNNLKAKKKKKRRRKEKRKRKLGLKSVYKIKCACYGIKTT